MRFHKARLSTDLRIHYSESGDARGTPVVFVHGWPDSWFSFSRVLAPLPATLRLVVFDQRGFGESDHPDSDCTIPGFAADLVALLDALDIDRAVLVGRSYGTFVARRAAIAAPERVTALALIDTGASTKITGANDLQAALRELPSPIPEPFAREFQSGTVHRPVPAEFFDLMARTMRPVGASVGSPRRSKNPQQLQWLVSPPVRRAKDLALRLITRPQTESDDSGDALEEFLDICVGDERVAKGTSEYELEREDLQGNHMAPG